MKINKSHLLAGVLATGLLIGCSSQEEPTILLEKEVSEIFKDMEKLPAIEDPDPEIEDPHYGEIFEKAYSMRLLDEIPDDGQVPLYLKELLKALAEDVRQANPEVKEKLQNVTLDFLVGVLDPRNPLDSELEDMLKKMLEAEKLKLSLMEVPVIEGMEELKATLNETLEALETRSTPLGNFSEEGVCAQEIYIQYGSGARNCSQDWLYDLEMIESNFLRRSFEAEERFEDRNNQIMNFSLEKLPTVVSQFRRVLNIIRENSTQEEVEEIRSNLGYLAAALAYHVRINVPLWHEYGLTLNEWYYYKELQLFAEIRLEKEAEAEVVRQHCIDWVNDLIKEEVNRRCPGDKPILY